MSSGDTKIGTQTPRVESYLGEFESAARTARLLSQAAVKVARAKEREMKKNRQELYVTCTQWSNENAFDLMCVCCQSMAIHLLVSFTCLCLCACHFRPLFISQPHCVFFLSTTKCAAPPPGLTRKTTEIITDKYQKSSCRDATAASFSHTYSLCRASDTQSGWRA